MSTITKADLIATLVAAGKGSPSALRRHKLAELEAMVVALAPATETYEVTLINRADGSVDGHRAGCADIAKVVKKERLDEPWTDRFTSKRDAFLEYNSDFIAENDGDETNTYPINWLPCADHVPATDPVEAQADATPEEPLDAPESTDEAAAAEFTAEPAEAPEKTADAIKAWQGNYNTVFAPAAELLAPKSVDVWTVSVSTMLKETHLAGTDANATLEALGEIEKASQAALRMWQKTQDRKGQTDMEKYNQNRSFLAGYLAAATGSKKVPTIAFAKDMEKALRPEAHAAGIAARKAAK